jgi:hypothetical protein
MNVHRFLLVAAMIVMSVSAGRAQWQVTLGANSSLNSGANLGTLANSGGNGSRATPYQYAFTSGGLDLGSYKVTTKQDVEDPYGTYFTLNLGGYSVTGTGAVAFDTVADSGSWEGSGGVAITNVGAVSIGGIDTYTPSGRSSAGPIQIGSATAPAGSIRLNYLKAYCLDSTGTGLPGTIALYGSSDIRIQTADGTNGDIDAHCAYQVANGQRVTVVHNGTFICNDIFTHLYSTLSGNGSADNGGTGSVLLDGGARTGTATVRDIRTSLEMPNVTQWMGNAGDVTIQNYADVTVRNINTRWQNGGAGNGIDASDHAGHVVITNITGNITIGGTIDLSRTSPDNPVPGQLRLYCDGTNTLASLDLSKLAFACLDAGLGSRINGLLTGTNGSPASGLANIGTVLRTPTNRIVYYGVSQNPSLSEQTLRLANAAGTAGAGGTLVPDYTGVPVALTYSTNAVHEATANNGSVSATLTITLSGNESFAGGNGEDFATNSARLLVLNQPAGLTTVVSRTATKTLTVSWNGEAASHAAADSITNLTLAFLDGAFATGPASAVNNASNSALRIDFDDPSAVYLSYSTNAFFETAANDGSIATNPAVTITAFSTSFSGSGSGEDFVAGGKVLVSNLPAGLAAVVTRVDSTHVAAALTGQAVWNNAVSNVANLTFAFQDAAFSGTSAAAVSNAVQTGLTISFIDPVLTYTGSGAFTEMAANNGLVTNAFAITLVGDQFAGTNGENFVGARVTASSPPAGLTWVVSRTSSTQLIVRLDGAAVPNSAANNASGLLLAFQDSAFAHSTAAMVTNSTSAYSVSFQNPVLTYSATAFYEAAANDGTVPDTATITLAGDTFTGNTGDDFAGGKVLVSNLPAGLAAHIRRTSATQLAVSFSGTAGPSDSAASRTNLTFAFQDSAFANSGAAVVTNAGLATLNVLFRDSYYVNQSLGSDANDGSANDAAHAWKTLTNAVAKAPANSVIKIMFSPHTESGITLAKGFCLQGQGANQTVVQAAAAPLTASNRIFTVNTGGNVTLLDLTLQHGYLTNGNGAAMVVLSNPQVTIQRCILRNNNIYSRAAGYAGGAVCYGDAAAGARLTVLDSVFASNGIDADGNSASTPSFGGAIHAGSIDALVVRNCTFSTNRLGSANWPYGGAINTAPGAGESAVIQNCSFVNNVVFSGTGGGGAISGNDGSRVTVESCVFQGNWSPVGIYGTCMIGCGISNSVYHTTASACLDLGGNIVTNNAGVDPVLADNGGSTPTHALLDGSAAIDHGSNPAGLVYDQRYKYYERTYHGRTDAGAFEFGAGKPHGTLVIWK